MTDRSLSRSGIGVEVNGDTDEKIRPVSIGSPSSSSSSSSSLSWSKKQNNTSYGPSSESETSLEYPDTPVTEEFKESTPKSQKIQVAEESGLSSSLSDPVSLDASINSGPPSGIQRRSGYYGRRTKEDRARIRAEKIASGMSNQSLPSLPLVISSSSAAAPVAVVSSYLDKVVQETVDTEKLYVKDLKDIIRGYLLPFAKAKDMQVPREDLHALFGNIKAIYKFNRKFLDRLKKSNLDPVQIGKCFVDDSDEFKIYADYCTNYPRSLETLSRYCRDPRFAVHMKRLQELLNHPLPLQTYLFKPIQRILKYHLLLKNIVSHHNELLPGHEILVQAHTSMMDVANHLNDVKRNQERRTEIQRLLLGSNGMDLSSFGDLILEDKFNSGLRDVNWAFLFRKGLLIAKKRRDDQLQIKTTIMCSNLMLVESIPREPLAFYVLPFDSPKTQFTLQARNLDQKHRWCREIKTLMLDSYNVAIPDKARQLLMRTGNGPQEHDRHFEIPKRHVAPEYLERRRLRRQSISSITANTRSLVENTIARTLEVAGRSSENLLLIKNEETRSRGSRSRPLRVDSGRHQTSERRSQSLDSLRNVEQDGVPIHQAVKSEQRNKVERGEERGNKVEQVEKQKQSQEKQRRESVKPPEDVEICSVRSGSREEKPTRLDLQKGKENCLEDAEGSESGLRCLEGNWYSDEYKEELAKTLVYEEKKANERIITKACEDEQRSQRISVNVYKDDKKNGRTSVKDCDNEQKTIVNVYKDDKKNERTGVKDCGDEQRGQRISVNVYKDEKKRERRNTKQYEDELQVSVTVYDDVKKSVKGHEDMQRISRNIEVEVEKRNEFESNETESREESGEESPSPPEEEEEEEEEKDASNTLTVSRNAALRANSFRRAVDLNRVDSKAVKKSQVQVRRKISEDQQESDEEAEEEEEDSSESNYEAIPSSFRPKLLPISGHDDSIENDSEEQSPLRFGQAAPYIAEKWSEICSAFGLADGNRSGGACDDSRHSSISFLSTTFESLAADELLTDVTQEDSFVTEEFFDSNKLEEVENGEAAKKVVSGGEFFDDAQQNVDDSSRAVESAQNEDSFEQLTDMSVEFLRQISSTPSKADISIEVAVANPITNPDESGNAACTNQENSDALRNIFKEIERFFPTDNSHSDFNAAESNNSIVPDRITSEHAAVQVLMVSHDVKSPTLRPGRHSYVTLERRGSAGDCLKGTLVQNSSSLPSLSDHVTSETCDSNTPHGRAMQAVSDRPSLVHSRKLSASDMTGYFSASKAPAAGDFPSMSGPSSSAGLSSKGLVQSRRSSNNSDAVETEKQDAAEMLDRSFEVGRLSESSDTHDVQNGTSPGAGTDVVDAKPLLAPKPVDKHKKRGMLLFEKVPSPNVSGVGAASQRQDARTERRRHDETKTETSNSSEIAAKSKRYQKSSEGNDCPTGLSPIRSPSTAPFEEIPYREVARRFDRQHTYVYRLARAYSSRVKQIQNEAALYQNTLKSGTRRTLRKWSTLDEGSSRHERRSSQSDVLRKDSSTATTPQNRDAVSLAENELELSTSGRSAFSVSSSPFLSLKNSKSVIDSWRPISESRAKARKSSKKLSKPFGLSFDGLPDFCFNGGNAESGDSEDCFDEEQDTSAETNLVKQRVRHFESHKESNC